MTPCKARIRLLKEECETVKYKMNRKRCENRCKKIGVKMGVNASNSVFQLIFTLGEAIYIDILRFDVTSKKKLGYFAFFVHRNIPKIHPSS